jgi:transcriptional regulator with XRE-family HTH domain
MPGQSPAALYVLAQFALGHTQRSLGALLGVSARTIMRYEAGNAVSYQTDFVKLAPLVYPRDPALAAELARAAGTTLEALGVKTAREPTSRHLVDAVVCAAGDAIDVPVRAVRPALLAAVVRAKELGLGIDDLISGLAPASPARAKAKR